MSRRRDGWRQVRAMNPRVFIDGESGTAGLQIRARLKKHPDLELVSLPDMERKDRAKRSEILNEVDLVILCLPDDASREAVRLIKNTDVRVIDVSTAHRVDPDWLFGFPEMSPEQSGKIAAANRVSNPGCYSTGAIALLRPLVAKGIVPADHGIHIHAVSGYSGGGRQLIESFEKPDADDPVSSTYYLYGLSLRHKHLPEIQNHSCLETPPLFVPSVGRYRQGMIVQVPLHMRELPGAATVEDIHAILDEWYGNQPYVEVQPLAAHEISERLDPEDLNGTNMMRLHVFGESQAGLVLLAAQLDNLGKGAASQAVQNLNLMLGLDRDAGLRERFLA